MPLSRVFLDTAYIQALLNRRDRYHQKARRLLPQIRDAQEAWVTEAVLIEVGNALSSSNRVGAVSFIQSCYTTPNIRVVSVDSALLAKGLDLYRSRHDQAWGLVDCISFEVMHSHALTAAATTDRHFQQAGFRALLLEPDSEL